MKEYTIVLTAEQLRVIGMGLAELPHKLAAPMFDFINKQIAAQEQEKEEVKAE